MDLFQHRYYRLNKTLMRLIGQWPYQSIRTRRGIHAVIIFLFFCSIVPQALGLIKYRDDGKIVLEAIIAFLFVTVCATKLISFVLSSQKTLKLLNRIRADWKVWARDPEIDVLHEYSERGEKIIRMYTAAIHSTLLLFMTQPVIPKIIDILLKNGTGLGKFPFPVAYYHLDEQKYYFYLIMYSCVCVYMMVMNLIASDVMLITYVQHICGYFAALGQKLDRIVSNDTSGKTRKSHNASDKRDMLHLASCIDRHNDAITYTVLIEAAYTWSFLFVLGFGMIMIVAILLEISLNMSDPKAIVRFIAYGCTGILHFYIECYISQLLMDHSTGIHFFIQNSQWYRLSPKNQKVVQLMTMRCSVPCQLTVGHLFTMSVRTFGQTVRTGLSYFTLVLSMQAL